MKTRFTKLATSLVFAVALIASASAQNFEGIIKFRKATAIDTINYVYYVKGNHVRIDEMSNNSNKPDGSFLIDTKSKKMISVNYERKMYMVKAPSAPAKMNGTAKVEKTKNVKKIKGYSCREYVVTKDHTEISYWVASGKFAFFEPMMELLNRKDDFSLFYQQIPGISGMFPFVAVEKKDGKQTGSMELLKVQKKVLSANLFNLPTGFKKFDTGTGH